MENKSIILKELEQISPAVATIGNRNVYTVPSGYFNNLPAQALAYVKLAGVQAKPVVFSVPDGYFDGLAGNIMAKIKQLEQNEAQLLPAEDTGLPSFLPLPYTVPQGYFDGLAGNVLAKIKAQQSGNAVFTELGEISTLPLIPMPYTTPANYFEGLAGNVLAKIKAVEDNNEVLQELKGISTLPLVPSPYTVANEYFSGLADNVLHKIKAQQVNNGVFDELEQLAPMLNSISRQMPYTVPQGYFEQFEIKAPVVEKEQAKVISINSSTRKWVTWAAAACVAAILGIGGYLYHPGKGPGTDTGKDVATMLAGVSSDDINNYLARQPLSGTDATPVSDDSQVPDLQQEIEGTSTQELQQYINDNSEPAEKRRKDI